MFRYIGFNWDPASPSQCTIARRLDEALLLRPDWQPALLRQGLRVYTVGQQQGINGVYPLPFAQGVILGRIFRSKALSWPASDAVTGDIELSPAESDRIAKTHGRSLITDFWGRYVALLRSNRCGTQVLRDPSGTLPCYRTQIDGVDIVFPWLEDLIDLMPGLPTLRISWEAIAAQLMLGRLGGQCTALEDVHQVLPGYLTPLGTNTDPPTPLWRAAVIAGSPIEQTPDIAARHLRETVMSCAHSWSTCYDGFLLRLSGGVDSAILLGSLRCGTSALQITCLNYHSEGSDSDERNYARLAAQRAGVTLVERERDTAFRLEDVLRVARTPEPESYVGRMGTNRIDADVAAAHGASAMFTGSGGDQLFFERRCTWPAADYLKLHGIGRGFMQAALDAARLGHVSLWHALRRAFADRNHRTSLLDGAAQLSLVRHERFDALPQPEKFLHPGLFDAQDLPIGKFHQLRDLSCPVGYYDPYLREAAPELINPLLSQPLIEHCLALPTYLLTHGGRGRALARQAFKSDIPREIAMRRSKGGMSEHIALILHRNLAFARDLLLDGHLVREGLIDRPRLETALAGRLDAIDVYLGEIHTYIAIEAWVQRFVSAPRR